MTVTAAIALLGLAAACSNSKLPGGAAAGVSSEGAQITAGAGDAKTGESASGSLDQGGTPTAGAQREVAQNSATSAESSSTTLLKSPPTGSTVGVSKEAIRISVAGGFSGLYKAIEDQAFANGWQVWAAEINASGGIFGRKVVLVKVDNAGTADGAIAACKEAQSNGTLLIVHMLSLDAETDCENSAGLAVFDQVPTSLKPWPNVIVLTYMPATAAGEVTFLKSRYMNAGQKKIGIIYGNNVYPTEYRAITEELHRQGMSLVHSEQVQENQATFVSEMSRMRASGAEVVMMLVAFESPGILRDAKAIGYSPQWYLGPYSSLDTIAAAGSETMRGVFGTRYITTTETPAFASYVEQVRKYQGDSGANTADSVAAEYYATGQILGKMLQLAGPTLNRQSFLAAARTIENFSPKGLMGPFTLKGRAIPVGEFGLVPMVCCKDNYSFRSLGPIAERF